MAMKAGADYKYHWLLQQAEMELGSGYFNPVTNPKARSLLIVLLCRTSPGQWFL